MANLTKTVKENSRDILKIDGPLGKTLILKEGVGAVEEGQVLSYEVATGQLIKYVGTGDNTTEAFTIALSSTDTDKVLVAVPGTTINLSKIKGATLATDFKAIKDLWTNGIILEEVR